MKSPLTIAAAFCGLITIAAPVATPLFNGENIITSPGEIVGVECMTVDASQVVTASVEVVVSEMTNAVKDVTLSHPRYDFTVTNFDGNAAIATNVVDTFNYADWATNYTWVVGSTTNKATTRILGGVARSNTNITESVIVGRALKAAYTNSVDIGSGSANNHYLKLTPASTMHFYGGTIRVSCGNDDRVTILVK